MNIIGGKLTKTSAEKYVDTVVQTSLGVNLVIQSVELRQKMLVLKYVYEIDYKVKQGKMAMEGELHMQGSEKEMKDFEDRWKKNKQIEPALAENIMNSIKRTGMAIGTLLAFSVGIPAPIFDWQIKVNSNASSAG
ncbi:MAG: hypothetical protein ABIG96_03945 [Candidatus Micrarchaeota archaeon]